MKFFSATRINANDDRVKWLSIRKHGLGGSDIAAVLGLSKFKSPVDVWADKTTDDVPTDDVPSEAAYWGIVQEDIVAKEFQRRTGLKVQRVNYLLRSGDDGWQIANIDRAIINPEISGTVRVVGEGQANALGRCLTTNWGLECKTANAYYADQWGASQLGEIKAGKITSEHKIPIYYETQVQWYMAVTGLEAFAVAVLIGGNDFRVYWVERDDELIEGLTARCHAFWVDHVLTKVPPEVTVAEDVKKLFPNDNGDMREATNDESAYINQIAVLNQQIKELEGKKGEYQDLLITSIKDAQGLTVNGEKVCTYKTQESTRFSSTDFKKAHPDMYKQFAKTSTTRVLRIS